ncbi:MAG: cyclic nucleotide-binding domain-containing protein [Flavobacteriales bacterium]|nr:cyclic nucleotide-binding domain-containing protein [Flavobacteriales bacterium]MBT4705078.1 cyclic nucleotide-binding domain-containing protein [Flavobacteriales bacterium]MBT4930098.1 cyclic nucleotide-binding domain-containing protein [Flavobacteriales bacterium]MBT5133056.1 cyclic nucleotide-binding domain-containing protein [Flavobacteriales bacterium]MBT6131931.1 cyclic nucleotide-binding domain-containing protein [Flavobacteriales bacterium]
MSKRNWKIVGTLCVLAALVIGISTFEASALYNPFETGDNVAFELSEPQHSGHESATSEEPEHAQTHEGEHGEKHGGEHAEEHGGGHHGPDISGLFFIIMAVFIGAFTRHFLKIIPIPFTAVLLIIGIILGVLNRMGLFMHWGPVDVSFVNDSFIWAANIDPHMLFFVFLPILIFEAAFAMDLHTFKKSAVNSVILAVPGILVALLLTGVMVYAIDMLDIGLEGWANWSLAFMFGSVISATDPVAVVALLKDLGASKKLGTLIEGESLLNDGTAIVLFMVFLAAVSGEVTDTNGFVEFLRVALGGVGVGVFIGWITLRWIKGVFNDAMVEISVVVAAAYATFFIAEHFLHVSGVLALVALGLLIGGFGRSSISPQVEHFMHEFWELAGFIANCLIFLIVGFVIAERTEFTANDFMVLGIIYIGVHVIRAIVMVMHYPFMKNTGYGLPKKDAIVVWFGALRGAIGLALALIVAGLDSNAMADAMGITSAEATTIKDQFLFLIAGTVTLTLLVNATTIKALVNRLGLLDIPPAKALMIKSSSEYMRSSAEAHVQKLRADRNLKKANWTTVSEYLPKEIALVQDIDEAELNIAKMAEHRTRVLEKEKSSYWKQFKEGMLGPDAVRTLTDTVNEILDSKGEISLSQRKDLELLWRPPKWLSTLQTWPLIGKATANTFFDRLAVSYDCAVGFVKAQEDCLKLMESMYRAEGTGERTKLEIIEQEINENIISGQTFMRNLRNTYPEIYRAISTRQAIRSVLNYELHTVDRLKSKGRLSGAEVSRITNDIEARMKQLMEKPPSIELPETKEMIESITWLKDLPKECLKLLERLAQNKIYSTGQTIIKNMSSNDGLFVIARGNANVRDGSTTLEVLGKSDGIGEMVLLTKGKTKNVVVAETPVTTIFLSSSHVERLMNEFPEFERELWKHGAARLAVRSIVGSDFDDGLDAKQWKRRAKSGEMTTVSGGSGYTISSDKIAVIVTGKGTDGSGSQVGMTGVLKPGTSYKASSETRLFEL